MHSFLLNLSLFAFALGKCALLTGFAPGLVAWAIFVRCPFPFCVLRELHEDDHDVRVPIERFTPFREQAELFNQVSVAGQLASDWNLLPANKFDPATSPARKVRRYA